MKSCNPSFLLGRHVSAIHAGNFPKMSFLILDRVHPVSTWQRLEQDSVTKQTEMDLLPPHNETSDPQWGNFFETLLRRLCIRRIRVGAQWWKPIPCVLKTKSFQTPSFLIGIVDLQILLCTYNIGHIVRGKTMGLLIPWFLSMFF